jgi:peptidyl-prolyl cis-trans isomerase A (cyclophilin A)
MAATNRAAATSTSPADPIRVGRGRSRPSSEGRPVAEELYATLKTNRGDITLQLFPDHAPTTVKNFVGLAEGSENASGSARGDRFYDGVVFHRVIDGFMIQGGDPDGTGMGGPGYTFKDEFHPELQFSKPYLLAMANAGPATNGSQFFITVGATPHLNMRHTIFGEVSDQSGRDVVDAIATTATDSSDRPVDDVVIESVEIERR